MAFVYHIELTNHCNLHCAWCSLTFSRRTRGFMSEETFRKVVDHMTVLAPLNYMILHNFGEPLLHPDLGRFVGIAARRHLNPGFSTNGELLTEARLEALLAQGLRWLCITFHTDRGREAYERCLPLARSADLLFWGRELAKEEAVHDPVAMFRFGVERQLQHSFAGTVAEEPLRGPDWRPPCDYLDRNYVCILQDGRVVPCLIDEHGAETLGTVDDLGRIQQKRVYPMCRRCDGFRFHDGVRANMRRLQEEGSQRLDFHHWRPHLPMDERCGP